MSVEVNPVNMRCGLSCRYCYQLQVRRETRNALPLRVNHEAIQAEVSRRAGPDGFSLFGGEPLLAAHEDIVRLWTFGLERYGKNGVQTSGAPITPWHMEAFIRYRVHVGFSIDGPGALNDARIAGGIEKTRATTDHSISMLRQCIHAGIGCSLIITLHRLNASADRLPLLVEWIRDLDDSGLGRGGNGASVRLHLLERDGPAGEALALTTEENVAALDALRLLERELRGVRFDLFADMRAKLLDTSATASCVWNDCDPWTTPAVEAIDSEGQRGLCSRVHKDGAQWTPAEGSSVRVRQIVLWSTPQKRGGCAGCRFFLQCGGQCPGTAIDGDWRKRSVDCPVWFEMLARTEGDLVAEGKSPLSLASDLDQRIGAKLAQIVSGQSEHGDSHGDDHGDHTDHGDHGDLALAGAEKVPDAAA